MNLVSTSQRASYKAAIDNLHDTFGKIITAVKFVKTPKSGTPTEDDNFDFTQSSSSTVQFDESAINTEIFARVKYIDRQDKEYQLVEKELNNLSIESGLIRIKVKKEDEETILLADNVIVDGLNTNVKFTNNRHGIFDIDYSTFYLQRTP